MPFSVIAGYWCSLVREVVLYGPLLAFYADSTPTVYVITYPIVPDRRAVNTRLPVSESPLARATIGSTSSCIYSPSSGSMTF